MEWDKLLSVARLGEDINLPYSRDYSISEFEKDYWRIVDCSAFRRLQDKTQVFPLDKSDFVRTRLTHSLEVSSLAKQLVAMTYRNLAIYPNSTYPFSEKNAQDAAEIAACAGLLHDIGNPPFGHFGEDVVLAWFKNNISILTYETTNGSKVKLHNDQLIADLQNFEGNAQAFRLLTKLHYVDSDHGLNLTAAVLNSLVKYPASSMQIDPESDNVCLHKLGYYKADEDDFLKIADCTGTFFDGQHHRHPLAFILEAADDIAYATADLEDSFKKGLFTIDQFIHFFKSEMRNSKNPQSDKVYEKVEHLISELSSYRQDDEKTHDGEMQAFQKWVNYTRHWLMYAAAFSFSKNYSSIMDGSFNKELIEGTFHETTMVVLKDAMVEFTFNSPSILKLELSAEKIIGELLYRFAEASVDWDVESSSRLSKRKAGKKLISLISTNHKEAYLKNKIDGDLEYNLYLRLLLIADFVSGMTDTYAKYLYQELSGIC